jgi:hypothetical protein
MRQANRMQSLGSQLQILDPSSSTWSEVHSESLEGADETAQVCHPRGSGAVPWSTAAPFGGGLLPRVQALTRPAS